ncbi:hypothetical protein CPB84DRAFT_355584 [Gymnopilus junonius]|uniref:Uncharacterized protein n=1 Tax=Gymnopilus junonius TaxID=109634 RepID=A0A9P5NA78_GYMJU|nr:hypothetical protein CPB84DRAFT_355584 [Gymnopilus junonius]
MEVAEAVEKYEVFWAMKTCEDRMRELLPEHGVTIFVHAIKHDILRLIDVTALSLARSPFLPVMRALPSHCAIQWVEYQDAYQQIFEKAKQSILLAGGYSSAFVHWE